MIGITKDKLFQKRLERVTGLRINNKEKKHFIIRNKSLMFLFAIYITLAITNAVLVYNFFRILSKL